LNQYKKGIKIILKDFLIPLTVSKMDYYHIYRKKGRIVKIAKIIIIIPKCPLELDRFNWDNF